LDSKWAKQKPKAPVKLNAKAAKFLQIKSSLLARKSKLAELIRTEAVEYEKELKSIRLSEKNQDFDQLTKRVEEIKKEKETARLEEAHRRKYQMWKRDNPRLRSAQGKY